MGKLFYKPIFVVYGSCMLLLDTAVTECLLRATNSVEVA